MIYKIKLYSKKMSDTGFHFFLKAKINDKKCWLLLDTGASNSVFDVSMANKFNFKVKSPGEMNAVGGGAGFQKFGMFSNYWDHTKSAKPDEGRFEVTKNEADKYFFKVPSLRNIEKTHPYFHDGSVKSLEEAVKIMAKTQLNYELNNEEVISITTFLKALNGDVSADLKTAPAGL